MYKIVTPFHVIRAFRVFATTLLQNGVLFVFGQWRCSSMCACVLAWMC